jgi:PAS domain S-box-containing protein
MKLDGPSERLLEQGARSSRTVHYVDPLPAANEVFTVKDGLRSSGIGTVGDIPWGTHFCHFYENKSDLLDVLVPYFKTGLEQNEFCIWGVFDPLDGQEARVALDEALPDTRARIAAGDIEIVPQSQWYRGDGATDLQPLVRSFQEKLTRALARGYAGMRVNVNAAWLAERDKRNLDVYEDEFSALIANRRVIMLCAYPIAIDRSAEILDPGYTHRFAIARQNGKWQVVETPELRQARAEVKRLNGELAMADIDRRQEAVALDRAKEALRASGARSLCYFELGLVGMAIVSPTEGCIEVNDRLCDMLGYERYELMQMTWAAVVHPDDLAVDIRNYERILAGEVEGYQIAKRWIRKDGDVVHTNSSLKCRRREDGSVDYLAAMVEEVTGLGPSPAGGPAGELELRPGTRALSGRELEVTRLIGLGRTVKEIAAGLALSEKTVSTYRTRILTKLNLKSTAELIHYALKNRLAK